VETLLLVSLPELALDRAVFLVADTPEAEEDSSLTVEQLLFLAVQ
jgi:hypothetical protein